MQNLTVGRYKHESVTQDWQGWIMFIRADGTPEVYLDRDPISGAVK